MVFNNNSSGNHADTNIADTQKKLVMATIKCIEMGSIENVTIRKIAKEADVNSATINYYFRSKENLISIALQVPLDNFFSDLYRIFDQNKNGTIQSMVKALFQYIFEGIFLYPNITRAYLHESASKSSNTSSYFQRLAEFVDKLKRWMQKKGTKKKNSELNIDMVQILHILYLTGTAPSLYHEFSGLDFSNSKVRQEYIDNIVRKYFGLE